nr:hypothetical protein [Desulfovibrio sp.]
MKIWREDGFYAYQIEVLTPVHIGGGEQFTPLDYVIREAAGGDYEAVLIDTSGWLAANSERPEAAKALDEGDMAGLRRALNASPDLSAFARGRIRISSASLGKSLLQKSRTIENKAELLPFIRNPFTMRPYIPASSLKGAISSALTDCLNEIGTGPKLRECRDNREYRKTMEAMFGKIGDHAMSWAKMGDIALPPDCSSIRSVVGVDIKPPASAERTPVETLDPVFFNKFKVCG